MKIKRTLWFAILPGMLLLTGCLGQNDINNLAIVQAVGIDHGEKPGTVRLSVQIVRPADARGQTGAPSGGTGEPIYSVYAEGKSIFEAIRNLSRFASRRVYWAHNLVIALNEDYARSGIVQMIDFFTRNHELRMRTWVVVTPDKASELISTITGLEVVPGDAIDKLFRYNEIVAEAPRTNMMRLQESYLSESTHPILAKLRLRNRGISNKKPEQFGSLKQVELSGTAVFNKDKMIGYLTPEESRGLLYFVEKVASTVIVAACPEDSGKEVTLELRNQKFHVTPRYEREQAQFDATLTANADVVEAECGTPLHEMQAELEEQLEAKLASDIRKVVEKAQKQYKVDFLKLGETFHNRFPEEWKALKSRWDEEFTEAQVSVKVEAHVKSPVLKYESTRSKKGESSN